MIASNGLVIGLALLAGCVGGTPDAPDEGQRETSGVSTAAGVVVLGYGLIPLPEPAEDATTRVGVPAVSLEGCIARPTLARGAAEIRRWPNGQMPVRFVSAGHYAIDRDKQDRFWQACEEWTSGANIRCVPYTGQALYQTVTTKEQGCESSVGLMESDGLLRTMRLGPKCWVYRSASSDWTHPYEGQTSYVLYHEIGHALGLWHEHQRPDAHEHIMIHRDRLVGGANGEMYAINFAPQPGIYTTTPYDFQSIMHYQYYQGLYEGLDPAIEPLAPFAHEFEWGTEDYGAGLNAATRRPTARDLASIRALYRNDVLHIEWFSFDGRRLRIILAQAHAGVSGRVRLPNGTLDPRRGTRRLLDSGGWNPPRGGRMTFEGDFLGFPTGLYAFYFYDNDATPPVALPPLTINYTGQSQ